MPLSSVDIHKIMTRYTIDNFRGVFSKDMLPSTLDRNESCVINIEDYFRGSGTHWVCVYNDPSSRDVEYFDSFGLFPPDVVLNYMKTGHKGIIYNDSEIQTIESIMCGYFCCYYIISRHMGRRPLDVLLQFDQEPNKHNEQIIKNIAYYFISV